MGGDPFFRTTEMPDKIKATWFIAIMVIGILGVASVFG
jgi:hypothetical protein